MATYKFSWINNGVEIVDPQITSWGVKFTDADVQNNVLHVDVTLATSTASFGISLNDIPTQSYNLDVPNLLLLIQYHLDQNYKISE